MKAIVIDFETIPAPLPQEIADGVRSGQVKLDNTIKGPAEMEKLLEKQWPFQAEGAWPIAVACQLIDDRKPGEIEGVETDELSEIAAFVREQFVKHVPERIVTYGGTRFDMPILQRLFAYTGPLEIPIHGRYNWHVDLAEHIPNFHNRPRKLKGNATSACALYGIKDEGDVDGSKVAALFEEDKANKTDKVLTYCMDDVKKTGLLYLRLSNLVRF